MKKLAILLVIALLFASLPVSGVAQAGFRLSEASVTLAVGEELTLVPTGHSGRVTWSSSDRSVATVRNGVVTPLRVGRTDISATNGGVTVSCRVNVVELRIPEATRTLNVGGRATLTIVGDIGDRLVRWSSSDSAIVSVNRNGVIVGRQAGRATITVRVGTVRLTRAITVRQAATPAPVTPPAPVTSPVPVNTPTTLLEAYAPIFGYVGVAAYNHHWNQPSQLQGNTLNFIKKHYNSITAENEMKPDFLLSNATMTASAARELGYVIPSGWNNNTLVPTINIDRVNNYLKIAHDNGLKVRFHTLVWYSQTPGWFFRTNYSANGAFVTRQEMDRRLEFYVKSLINIVHSGQYSDVVYAWDVVNEYVTNRGAGGWGQIYGNDDVYVRNAFRHAHDQLTALGKRSGVGLFYNDFNTYENVEAIITLINDINSGAPQGARYCDGIGMQMHLDAAYPSVSAIGNTIDAFTNAGFEIQITELDVTLNFHSWAGTRTVAQQERYWGDLFTMLIQKQRGGANITSITFWGLWDNVSWRSRYTPLLFTGIDRPKPAFDAVMNAAINAG
jgi:endo-1,4-beta-xylanase